MSASQLSARGSGLNKAVHAAAGGPATLEALTRAVHPPCGVAGSAYPVSLPAGNPLREGEGVHAILHVVGPNMNADRPQCLHDDYAAGCKQLADTYAALFRAFHALL